MDQPLAAGAADAPDMASSSFETPTLLAPQALPPIAPAGIVASDNLAFVAEVRTHMTTILGFAEMLDDPSLALPASTRAEYGLIVATSGELLATRLQRRCDELRLAS